MIHIADNIRRIRNDRGWSQAELAERSGIASVKMIESGRANGRVGTLQAIATALGVELATLLAPPGYVLRRRRVPQESRANKVPA